MKLNIYLKLYQQVAREFVEVFKSLREKIINGEIEIDIDFDSSFEDQGDGIDIELDDSVLHEIRKIIYDNSLLNDYYELFKNNMNFSNFKEYTQNIYRAFGEFKSGWSKCPDCLPTPGTEEFIHLYKLLYSMYNNFDEENIQCFITEISKNAKFKQYCEYVFEVYYPMKSVVRGGFEKFLDDGLTIYKESISDEYQAKLKLAERYIDPLFNEKDLSNFNDPSILKLIDKESYLTLDTHTIHIKHIRPRF